VEVLGGLWCRLSVGGSEPAGWDASWLCWFCDERQQPCYSIKMSVTIEEFQTQHLPEAAQLLSLRWQAERKHSPELSPALENPQHAEELLKSALLTNSPGVVARGETQVVGYMLGSRILPSPVGLDANFYRARSVLVKYAWHAVAPGFSEIYRDMYTALGKKWLAEGFLAHYIIVPASDKAARDVWSYLGFGTDMARALRDTFPPPAPLPGDRDLRQAVGAQIAEVMSLLERLERFHAQAPVYMPFLRETHSANQARVEALVNNHNSACFLAYEDKKPVGLQIYQPLAEGMIAPLDTVSLHHAYTLPELRSDGVGTALLTRGLIWAIERGYQSCAVGWMTANGDAHQFWLKRGFKPYRYRMFRAIDERVLWGR
jgi:GNAT superfamily N-acetyltransferase